jgi:hypothetical protein
MIKNYKLSEILLLIGIATIIIFTLAYSYSSNSKANKIYDSITTSTALPSYALKIDSDPAGVSVESEKYCDSVIQDKQTPFMCSIPRDIKTITITAPTDFTKDGKKYTFSGWSGCSVAASDKDKNTCEASKPYKDGIKATYTLTAVTTKSTPPPAPVVEQAPKANCDGTIINDNKTCRFVITYDNNRLPGRISAFAVQTNPLTQLWQEITFTAECSNHEACVNEVTQQQTTGAVKGPRIDFDISKATTINIDIPMSQDGDGGSYYLLSKGTYNKATYANGGGGTYYDGLDLDYTHEYKN